MRPIRVLIVDDHNIFRSGLQTFCQGHKSLELVGEAANGQEAVEMARRLKPDVILMDVEMPVMDGVRATSLITTENPDIGVIMLTLHDEDEYVFKAIKSGARGYLLKDDENRIIEAIEIVYQGGALINPKLATRVLDEFRSLKQEFVEATTDEAANELNKLTDNEMKILKMVAKGVDNQTIADNLGLSDRTIANRLTLIYQKLQVNNRTEAALYALRMGWAPLNSKKGSSA